MPPFDGYFITTWTCVGKSKVLGEGPQDNKKKNRMLNADFRG